MTQNSTTSDSGISLESLRLDHGAHSNPQSGMCVMEAAAYFAREPHSDHPECVDPVIGAFMRGLNDRLSNEKRQQLKPFVLKVIGTRGTNEHQQLRRAMITEWYIKQIAAQRAEAAGLTSFAEKFRALPEVTPQNLNDVKAQLRAIRDEAWSIRQKHRDSLAEKIKAEILKTGKPAAAAVAVAVAVAAAAADAVAAAAADAVAAAVAVADAVADADAVAAAAADAVADAAAVAVAVADAAAAAAAVAVAVADADAVAAAAADAVAVAAAVAWKPWGARWYKVRSAVYDKLYPKYRAKYDAVYADRLPSALVLLDSLCDVYRVESAKDAS